MQKGLFPHRKTHNQMEDYSSFFPHNFVNTGLNLHNLNLSSYFIFSQDLDPCFINLNAEENVKAV